MRIASRSRFVFSLKHIVFTSFFQPDFRLNVITYRLLWHAWFYSHIFRITQSVGGDDSLLVYILYVVARQLHFWIEYAQHTAYRNTNTILTLTLTHSVSLNLFACTTVTLESLWFYLEQKWIADTNRIQSENIMRWNFVTLFIFLIIIRWNETCKCNKWKGEKNTTFNEFLWVWLIWWIIFWGGILINELAF